MWLSLGMFSRAGAVSTGERCLSVKAKAKPRTPASTARPMCFVRGRLCVLPPYNHVHLPGARDHVGGDAGCHRNKLGGEAPSHLVQSPLLASPGGLGLLSLSTSYLYMGFAFGTGSCHLCSAPAGSHCQGWPGSEGKRLNSCTLAESCDWLLLDL